MEKEEIKRNTGKRALVLLIAFFMLALLTMYWIFPTNSVNFNFKSPTTSNFSQSLEKEMQFYHNMRFESPNITYEIENKCSLQKRQDMRQAFDIIENLTILDFSFSDEGMIQVYCEKKSDQEPTEKGFFIAGEGGPVNVTIGKYFNVIHGGEIILIKDSDCERPNVAIHELLHVLGFDHSENENNIMYPVSKCKQIIGEDMINKINEIYSYPSLPDLEFDSASAQMKGRVLDLNLTIRNEGLVDAGEFEIIVYGDGKEIKRIQSEGIGVGYAQKITITNNIITRLKINSMAFSIQTNYEEINKDNNEIALDLIE